MVWQVGVVKDARHLDTGDVAHHLHRVEGARTAMPTGISVSIVRN
jgi:hypothetical protein